MPDFQRLQLLYKIGQELNSSLDIHEVMSRVLALATTHVQADKGSIFLLDRQGEVTHHILVSCAFPPDVASRVVQNVLDQGLAGWIIRERRGAIVQDVHQDPRWLHLPGSEDKVKSVVAAPIVNGPNILGLITLHHSKVSYFSEHHLAFLNAIANQAAIALENARLYTEQERIVKERTKGLVETTNFLRNVIDNAIGHAIVAVDMQGFFLIWNKEAVHMFGYTAQEVIGRATAEIFYGPQFMGKRSRRNLLKVILETREDSSHAGHLQFFRRDGHRFPADITVNYLRSTTGQPVGILGIIRDVTAQAQENNQASETSAAQGLQTHSPQQRRPLEPERRQTDETTGPIKERAPHLRQRTLGRFRAILSRFNAYVKQEEPQLEIGQDQASHRRSWRVQQGSNQRRK